jgi:hypothetical protein
MPSERQSPRMWPKRRVMQFPGTLSHPFSRRSMRFCGPNHGRGPSPASPCAKPAKIVGNPLRITHDRRKPARKGAPVRPLPATRPAVTTTFGPVGIIFLSAIPAYSGR